MAADDYDYDRILDALADVRFSWGGLYTQPSAYGTRVLILLSYTPVRLLPRALTRLQALSAPGSRVLTAPFMTALVHLPDGSVRQQQLVSVHFTETDLVALCERLNAALGGAGFLHNAPAPASLLAAYGFTD